MVPKVKKASQALEWRVTHKINIVHIVSMKLCVLRFLTNFYTINTIDIIVGDD